MEKNLYSREQYLSKVRGFYHACDLIKVFTGIRRCGKSSIMELIKYELIHEGADKENIFYINLDKKEYKNVKTVEKLESIIDELPKKKELNIFL